MPARFPKPSSLRHEPLTEYADNGRVHDREVNHVEHTLRSSNQKSNCSRKAGRHEAQYRYGPAYPDHVYNIEAIFLSEAL